MPKYQIELKLRERGDTRSVSLTAESDDVYDMIQAYDILTRRIPDLDLLRDITLKEDRMPVGIDYLRSVHAGSRRTVNATPDAD